MISSLTHGLFTHLFFNLLVVNFFLIIFCYWFFLDSTVVKGYILKNFNPLKFIRTSLVGQWLRIHLPMQGTWVQALVWEDLTCHGATKPMHHNYWACTLESVSHNYWACMPQLLKPALLEPMPCNEKPLQWEAHVLQWRVAPVCHN